VVEVAAGGDTEPVSMVVRCDGVSTVVLHADVIVQREINAADARMSVILFFMVLDSG